MVEPRHVLLAITPKKKKSIQSFDHNNLNLLRKPLGHKHVGASPILNPPPLVPRMLCALSRCITNPVRTGVSVLHSVHER